MSTKDESVIAFLRDLGLTKTERELYITGLEYPASTVNSLVERTNVNRTTAYHALSTLEQKGFCKQFKQDGKLTYTMTSAHDLQQTLQAHELEIAAQKQRLSMLVDRFPVASTADETVHAEKFVGISGVQQAIEKALYCQSRIWKIIAPKHNFFSEIDSKYAQYFMQTRRDRNIMARTLWERQPNTGGLSVEDLLMRKPRYLPPEFSNQFNSVVILFDDSALFITSAQQQSAVLVKSTEMVSTLNVMFDALWSLAEKPFASDR